MNFKPTIEKPITLSAVFQGDCFLLFFSLHQRTPIEEAVQRSHMDIVHYLRGDDISETDVSE